MKLMWICSMVLLLIVAAAAAPTASAEVVKDAVKQAASASNQFGLDLYARLAAGQEKGNLFLSPYSIETALAMTLGGARGRTAQEMARVLHADALPADQLHAAFAGLSEALNESGTIGRGGVGGGGGGGNAERAFDLVVANALWVQQGFDLNRDFVKKVKEQYRAAIEAMDFAGSAASREQARRAINAWVEKQTRDKIKDLLGPDSLDAQTRLILTNAIYFKSAWDSKFSESMTKQDPFHVDGAAETANVAMMHQTHRLRYADNDEVQVVEMPYRFRRLSILVLLPRKVDGLAAVEKSLDANKLGQWTGAMQDRQVELSLPKFKFTSRFGLARTLGAMGIEDAFTPGKADLSGISSGERLFVQDVIHQAFVDVNEEGTEAAAATAIAVGASAVMRPPEKAVFNADHPFLFLIRDNQSGCVLFLGRVGNPKT
jgi:serpin B